MEFNLLPPEIHLGIFSYLSASDVMRIRRVCNLWNALINGEFKFKRLRFQQLYKQYEIYDSQSYDFGFTSTRSFLDYTSTNSKFSRIRYLHVDLKPEGVSELQDAFDFLNTFKFLEEASFECRVYRRLNGVEGDQKQFVISLSRLEKVTIYFHNMIEGANASVLLDLPSLLCLSIDSLTRITIGHPEKLRTLATTSLFGGQLDYSKFTSLTNIFTGRRDLPSISASFLERFPSLKEIHLGESRLPRDYRLPEPSLSKAKPKIFFYGFEVSAREIESEGAQWPSSFYALLGPEDTTEDTAPFIVQYLHRSVDDNPHVHSIDYNGIAGELGDSVMFGVIPQKFPKIPHLRISGTVADKKRLLKFIDKLKVEVFNFRRTSLPQWFFKKLAENHLLISCLDINEPTMSILSGDFDFVFNFKNLSWLHFRNCPLSLNFVARALKELKSLFSLTIYQPGNFRFSLTIPKPSQDAITIRCHVDIIGSRYLSCQIPTEEAPGLMNALQRQLNVDGAVCPRELQTLLDHLRFEKENALFWMRKYLYDQRHSICLSKEQMSLLNLCH